jgi:hypothetical protein
MTTIAFLCTFMSNPTSITMNEQDRQEIIRDAQSEYNGDKALFNRTYVEYMHHLIALVIMI